MHHKSHHTKKQKTKTKNKIQKTETNKKTQRTPNYEQLCNSVIDGLQIHHFFCTYNTNYQWCITVFKIDLLKIVLVMILPKVAVHIKKGTCLGVLLLCILFQGKHVLLEPPK